MKPVQMSSSFHVPLNVRCSSSHIGFRTVCLLDVMYNSPITSQSSFAVTLPFSIIDLVRADGIDSKVKTMEFSA